MPKVITANDLITGAVVFLDVQGQWVAGIGDAAVFVDSAAVEPAMTFAKADEARAVIVDPFVVDLKDGVDARAAMTLRNAIRAFGPTIDYHPAPATD